MSNKYGCTYQPGNSVFHNSNAVIKVCCYLIFILACFFRYDYYLLLIMSIIIVLNIIFSNLHLKYYMLPVMKLMLLVLPLSIILYRLNFIIVDIISICLKIIFIVVYTLAIIFTTPPDKIGRGISKVLNTFNFLGLNHQKIEIKIAYFLKKIYYNLSSRTEIIDAQALIGKDFTQKNFIVKKLMIFKNRKLIRQKTGAKLAEYKSEMKYKLADSQPKKYPYRKKIGIIDVSYLGLHLFIIILYIMRVR